MEPSQIYVNSIIKNVGLVARDAFVRMGELDIIFWSFNGIRTLRRTIQELATPVNEVSSRNRDYFAEYLDTGSLSAVRMVYSAVEGFVLLLHPTAQKTWCFDVLNCRDFAILSTSMERFLLRRGDYLETRPIKGTRPRGQNPEEDAASRQELSESLKDDAELSMIVDLLRNDLGKVCRARTVKVKEHKRLEANQNVYHLVSIVEGLLRPETSHVDILRATFPGGSITGCPKIRAMDIIDELEPSVRHVYTGAIGYLGLNRNLDLNVAIRTVVVSQGLAHFSVGGRVVNDSDEEAKYEETLHKARNLFRVIEGAGKVWGGLR